MKETRTVGRNIVSLVLGQFMGIAVSFLYVTFIPRQLGPQKLGQLSYWLSLAFILSAVLDFGASFYQRYIPELKVKQPAKVKALLKASIKIDGIILCGLIPIVAVWLKVSFLEFVVIFLGAILTTVLSIFSQIFYCYEKLGYSAFIRNIIRLIRIALVLSVINFGVKSLLWVVFLPELIAILLYGRPFIRIIPPEKAYLPEGLKRYISFASYAYLGTVCYMVTCRASVILAKGIAGDLRMVGYTSLAVELSLYCLKTLGVAVFVGALPSGLRYLASRDHAMLDRFLELSWRYSNIIIFPLVFGFFILGKNMVEIFLGDKYLDGLPLIIQFLPSAIILFWLQAHQIILTIYENKKALFLSSFFSLVIFILVAFITMGKMGLPGLPFSLSLGLFMGYLYAWRNTKSQNIKGYFISVLKPLTSSLFMIILLYWLKETYSFGIVYLLLIGCISYLSSLIFLRGVIKDDFLKLKAVLFS